MNLYQEALSLKETMVAYRRSLHQIPELGLDLPETSAYVESELQKMGYETERLGSSGIVAIAGKENGKCFLIRADMDALPVREETGLEYSSVNGRMHACGHDCHMASMLGAAKLLKMHEDEINGQVKIMLQPAEETMEGAAMMINSGVLNNPKVDAALGIHTFTNMPFPAGTVAMLGADGIFAAIDWFTINIEAKSCHGAQPHMGVDPINVMAHILISLQSINAREMDPTDNIVLTIGQVHSGTTSNVIPASAMMSGTLRTIKNETRDEIKARMESIVSTVASVFRAEANIEWGAGCPVLTNEKALHSDIKRYLKELDELTVLDYSEMGPAYKAMISEDFAYISNEVPSTYLLVSGGKTEDGYCYPQHHAKAIFSDDALPVSAAVYAQAAIRWLNEH